MYSSYFSHMLRNKKYLLQIYGHISALAPSNIDIRPHEVTEYSCNLHDRSHNSSIVTDYGLAYHGSRITLYQMCVNSICRDKGSYSMKLITHLYLVLRLELYIHVSCAPSCYVVKHYSHFLYLLLAIWLYVIFMLQTGREKV